MGSENHNISELDELRKIFENLKEHLHNEKTDGNEDAGEEDVNSDDIMHGYFSQLLEGIENKLEETENASLEYIKLLSMKASLIYEQAKLKLFHESSDDALQMLQSTLELIKEYSEHEYMLFLYLRIVNHLSYLLSKIGKLDEARNLLETVLYKDYSPDLIAYSTEDLFSSEVLPPGYGRTKFNKLMLNNIQMLAWIYGNLGFHDLHAFMEHLYLQKQLDMDDFSVLQWTLKCCRLVTVYLATYNWNYARYYLAAVGALHAKKSADPAANLEMPQAKAELSKTWLHYGLHLFTASKRKMLERMYDNEGASTSAEECKPFEVLEQHKFKGLNVTVPNIPANYITETQDARTLFMHTQNSLKQMRTFYTLRSYPLQYVNAVLDLSELYRFLAFYENDLESQYNVQRRRSETLETLSHILKEVRPNCYTAVSVELWRELAEVQIELMGINLKRLYTFEAEKENPEITKKRIEAVADVHDKLEAIGNIIGPKEHGISEIEGNQDDILDSEEVL